MTAELPTLTYLSPDTLAEGVGASQVLAYVERLAGRGLRVELHSFEKQRPDDEARAHLARLGVTWTAHAFGRAGSRGGVGRILRGAAAVRSAPLLHARSELAAASALLARPKAWVWDARSLLIDQRLSLGTLRDGSPELRVLRAVERAGAARCDRIVTLTAAVVPELARRHGDGVAAKCSVITTCVDLDRFALQPLPSAGPVRFLLSGTLNGYYDVPAMLRLVERARRRGDATLELLTPGLTSWEPQLAAVRHERTQAEPAGVADHVAASHVGLSVCRLDAGVSLLAAMPTKIGEFLATGRPVVVNHNLGDAGPLLEDNRCGVALRGTTDADLDEALDGLETLLADPDTPTRCRRLAEGHFDLDRAVDRLLETYRAALGG